MNCVEGWYQVNFGSLLSLIRNGYSGQQVGRVTSFPVSRIETISDGVVDLEKVGFVDSIPNSYLLKDSDILFSNINSLKHIGKAAQVKAGTFLFHGMNLLVFRAADDVDTLFLFYKLTSAKPWFEKMATQAINQASINQTTIKELVIEIPTSKSEQTKIAKILSAVDRAIEKTEALIAKQQRIKTGLMQDLLTHGIDEHGNLRSEQTHQFKDSPLGRIPVEWKSCPLGEIGSWFSGGTPSKADIRFWNGGVPWVCPKDMKQFEISSTIDTISDYAIETGVRLMPIGSVYIVIRGMILAHTFPVGYGATPMAFNQDIKAVVTREDVEGRYLTYWLDSHSSDFLKLTTTATHGTKRFDIDDLFGVEIGVPLPEEQNEILHVLDQLRSNTERTKEHAKKLSSLKIALMQDLLTGKVRVTPLLDAKNIKAKEINQCG
jgi:type I restriction enzyme, S subunit